MFGGSGRRAFERTDISPVERLLGFVVLGLLAGFGAFVYIKGQHFDPSLFALDEQALVQAAPARQSVRLVEEEGEEGAVVGAPATGSGGLLEDLAPEGWRSLGQIERFAADELYIKINGRAEQYLAYAVVGMEFAGLADGSGERFLDIYLYDMGSPEGAFGIFSVERPQDAPPLELGRQGYRAGGSYFFWQGRYYAQVLASEAGEEMQGAALAVARRVEERLEDGGEALWGLALLPEQGRVSGSVQYFMRDALSLDFLGNTFTARYQREGVELTLFLSRLASPEEAGETMRRYLDYLGEYGQVVDRREQGEVRLATGDLGGFYDVVFHRGAYFGGVNLAEDRAAAEQVAGAWAGGLGR